MENIYEKLKNMSKEQLEEAYNFFLINDDGEGNNLTHFS